MNQKGLGPILIVLIIAAAIGGYLVYSGKISPPQKQVAQPSPTTNVSPVPNGTEETANWKIYTDSENKFSFKYPSEWNLNQEKDAVKISNANSNLSFQVSPYPSIDFDKLYEKPDGTINQNPVFIRTKIKNLEINGYKATMYTTESTPANQNKALDISVYIVRGAPVTMISGSTKPSSKESFLLIFNQILSTFKFIPQ